ncbi:MAG: XRE family transcriptional regulator [Rhodospirillaceae bacterium]|nr:MAG: XRE family transcriptional regulator [Rhodospirillaceae bacterium]
MSRKISVRTGSDNVFRDLGFNEAEAQEALAKAELIHTIAKTITKQKLTQIEAARRCHTDQPTLSKVLRGRMESVTIDKLASWLMALGRNVEIRVGPTDRKTTGRLVVRAA